MSVINQVLRDLDARRPGAHGAPIGSSWIVEPEALGEERPRRRPVLTLGVPAIVVAISALFLRGDPQAPRSPTSPTAAMADAWSVPAGSLRPAAAIDSVAALRVLEVSLTPAAAVPPAQTPIASATSDTPPAATTSTPVPALADATPLGRGSPQPADRSETALPAVGASGWSGSLVLNLPPAGTPRFGAPVQVASIAPLPASIPALPTPVAPTGTATVPSAPAPGAPTPPARAGAAEPAAAGPVRIERTSPGTPGLDRVDGLYRQAMQRYHAGQSDEAARLLRSALLEDPTHVAARQALTALLIDRRDEAQAREVLLQGLSLDPRQTDFALLAARLMLRTGDLEGAIRVLQRAATEHASAPLHAMLADSLSRARRDREALAHWGIAVQRQPAQAGWWLGLAISLEADGRPQDARSAYERALVTPGLRPEAGDYANERLNALR